MPLLMCNCGEEYTIKKVGGDDDTRLFLGKLGCIVGSKVEVVSSMAGNIIIKIKDTRVAINKDLAMKILV